MSLTLLVFRFVLLASERRRGLPSRNLLAARWPRVNRVGLRTEKLGPTRAREREGTRRRRRRGRKTELSGSRFILVGPVVGALVLEYDCARSRNSAPTSLRRGKRLALERRKYRSVAEPAPVSATGRLLRVSPVAPSSHQPRRACSDHHPNQSWQRLIDILRAR
jgi:hypothetical protein